MDPVEREYNERHEYVRHNLSTYVTWFTFFLTLLLGAMGWSLNASLNEQGEVAKPFPFFCMVALFSAQLIFAIIATRAVAKDFRNTDARIDQLVTALNYQTELSNAKQPQDSRLIGKNPFPHGIHTAMALMKWTLVSNFFFWLGVALYVYRNMGAALAYK